MSNDGGEDDEDDDADGFDTQDLTKVINASN